MNSITAIAATTTSTSNDYVQPPFFKFLQKNNDGTFGLNTDDKLTPTPPKAPIVVVGMGLVSGSGSGSETSTENELDSPLEILSAVSASTSTGREGENPEKKRRLE